ncbi:MAG: hypothetical protein WD872_04280 [Pirellulaceae bacterium]
MKRFGAGLGALWVLSAVACASGQEPADQPSQPATFDMVLLSLKNDWQAMRYQTQSGETWYAFQGDWKPVPEESGKPPAGEYKVSLSVTGENDWIALRLERKSGRSWRLATLKWIEMKVREAEKPPLPEASLEAE